MLSGDCVSEQDLPLFFDDVITLAGRHEVPATKFELLTAVALKLLRDTRVAWPGLGKCVDDARKQSTVLACTCGLPPCTLAGLGGSNYRATKSHSSSLNISCGAP
jgi:hypothetical protein